MSREANMEPHSGKGVRSRSGPHDLVIGVDLGATNAKVGLVDAEGRVVRRCVLPTEPRKGPEATAERIARAALDLIRQVGVRAADIRGAGIGTPGAVDAERGVVVFWPNVPSWRGVPIRRLFEQRLGLPCVVENDGNAAALAEHWMGAGRGLSYLVLLTLGTGIGGGIVLDGRLWRGASGAAGELGHMSIDPSGPRCACGGRGCLQAYASAPAMVSRMRQALASGVPSVLAGREGELTAELIHRAAVGGDRAARRNICQTGRYLGVGVSNLMHLLNPQAIVFSGGVTAAGTMLLNAIEEEVARRTLEASRRGVKLGFSALADDAGIIGAARRFMLAGAPRA